MVAEVLSWLVASLGRAFPDIGTQQVDYPTNEKYLKNDVHFNVYMVHGGTNFGFTPRRQLL